ncbi:MAG TPA: flavodoxin [Thermotogota bacterium]|nr:flavodoxin [Thermotogota bacterium]HPJ89687.1 flavodoxin [Thermotogota bacterium]HPR97383.1 flavodoxin [Thermotogota bacterium]
MAKTLVLYYSYEGNTKKIAEIIAKELGADIEEVKPVKEMSSRGFGKFVWGGSQVVMNRKPALRPIKMNPDDYELIFIGTPVWAFTYAPPIKTVIETGLFKDKKVAFFCTHEGGPGKTEEKAKKAIEKENEFIGSINFANVAKDFVTLKPEVERWAKEMSDK